MTRAVLTRLLISIMSVLAFPLWAGGLCPPVVSSSGRWLTAGIDDGGYWIRVDPGSPSSLRPGLPVVEAVDQIAEAADVVVLHAGSSVTLLPLDPGRVWRSPDPLACLGHFAASVGLGFVEAGKRVWIMGPPATLEKMALLVFAYPLDPGATVLPVGLEDERTLRALLRTLPTRVAYEVPSREDGSSLFVVAVGLDAVPGHNKGLVLFNSLGAFTNPSAGLEYLYTSAARVDLVLEGRSVVTRCLWSQAVDGFLLAQIREDLDGDRVDDLFFMSSADGDRPDTILSGSDGRTIAEVAGDYLAVQRQASGPPLFAVAWRYASPFEGAAVLRYSSESDTVESARVRTADSKGPRQSPYEALATELGGREGVRVYSLPGLETPALHGYEHVTTTSPPAWGRFINRDPARTIAEGIGKTGLVLVRYISAGYEQARRLSLPAQQQ